MKYCDCDERIGVEINSYQLFIKLKSFFEEQTEKGFFVEIPVEKPYFQGYNLSPDVIKDEYKWYADRWYKCTRCGILCEIKYPDFPAKGFVRKFEEGQYQPKY